MAYSITQVNQEVQLGALNGLKQAGYPTTNQLGQLTNSLGTYRDSGNPCQSYGQTCSMSSFRDKNLIYFYGSGGGPTIGVQKSYISVWAPYITVYGTTSFQGFVGSGYINSPGTTWIGSGGSAGSGGGWYYNGSPGSSGSPAISFSGSSSGYIYTQQGAFYGGGGGGGGGGGAYGDYYDYNGYNFRIEVGGGGGGGGRTNGGGGGGAPGNGAGSSFDTPGQPGQGGSTDSGGGGGSGGTGFSYEQAVTTHGGAGGAGGNAGQPGGPGQPGYPDYRVYSSGGSGGSTSPAISVLGVGSQGSQIVPS